MILLQRIVNNVSEQLSTIIEHEKVFRGIWLKKFGTLLSLINDDPLTPSLQTLMSHLLVIDRIISVYFMI